MGESVPRTVKMAETGHWMSLTRHDEGSADEGLDDAGELGLDVGDGPGGNAAQGGGHALDEGADQDGHLEVEV